MCYWSLSPTSMTGCYSSINSYLVYGHIDLALLEVMVN
jgi:hypothetical protein